MSHLYWIGLLAQAQGKGGGSAVPGCGGGGMMNLLPLILMFVVFYFLLIRPQQKKAKAHQEMLRNLKRGDKIMTSGGLLGTITGLTDQHITLEVAEKIRLRILRSHIMAKQSEGDSNLS
ncbi:MAG: preprotein translocase subunit YajC [Pseudomonadota bacterium]